MTNEVETYVKAFSGSESTMWGGGSEDIVKIFWRTTLPENYKIQVNRSSDGVDLGLQIANLERP